MRPSSRLVPGLIVSACCCARQAEALDKQRAYDEMPRLAAQMQGLKADGIPQPQAPPGCMLASRTFTNSSPAIIPAAAPPAVVASTINVVGLAGFVLDVDVRTSIRHSSSGDLDITLTSPSGRVVTLTTDNGGTFDDVFDGTLWDDQADASGQFGNTAVDHAYADLVTAPALTPEEPLGAFRRRLGLRPLDAHDQRRHRLRRRLAGPVVADPPDGGGPRHGRRRREQRHARADPRPGDDHVDDQPASARLPAGLPWFPELGDQHHPHLSRGPGRDPDVAVGHGRDRSPRTTAAPPRTCSRARPGARTRTRAGKCPTPATTGWSPTRPTPAAWSATPDARGAVLGFPGRGPRGHLDARHHRRREPRHRHARIVEPVLRPVDRVPRQGRPTRRDGNDGPGAAQRQQ